MRDYRESCDYAESPHGINKRDNNSIKTNDARTSALAPDVQNREPDSLTIWNLTLSSAICDRFSDLRCVYTIRCDIIHSFYFFVQWNWFLTRFFIHFGHFEVRLREKHHMLYETRDVRWVAASVTNAQSDTSEWGQRSPHVANACTEN